MRTVTDDHPRRQELRRELAEHSRLCKQARRMAGMYRDRGLYRQAACNLTLALRRSILAEQTARELSVWAQENENDD